MQIPEQADFPIIQEILNERDRGAAVVAGGFLEAKLTDAIKTCLRDDPDTARQLLKATGPLGAFGNKALLGYMLRLYRKETRNDLILIGEIRNRFAHTPEPITFASGYIRERCEKLTLYDRVWRGIMPDFDFPQKPFDQQGARKIYLEVVSLAANFLHHWINNPAFRESGGDDRWPF
jgi:hypothetical protein